MNESLFAPGYKSAPYWWERTPRPELPRAAPPARAEVAIVGSGYTGLSAAIQTARGGRHTLVLDAEDAGWGCSSRNGGQIGTSIKPDYETLAARHGGETALRILRSGHNALDWIGDFVAAEGIDCDFKRAGRFHGAHNPASYEKLAESLSKQPKGLETGAHMVPRAEQHGEIGTDLYHGGMVLPRHCALDPARYHQGLLDRAMAAGVEVASRCAVTAIERAGPGDGGGFRLQTARGSIEAREVVVATNGYTGGLTPWQRRRVIPIGSYMIATEPLAETQIDRVMPRDRVLSDSRKLVYYYRASPDRRRVLFGGRVSAREVDPRIGVPRLHAEMTRIFPELAETRVTHGWMGFVGYTFDTLPHLGRHDGIHYAMGYCGSGISLASYFGARIGQQVLGRAEARTGLEGLGFPGRPYYWGWPWFLGSAIRYYRWHDSLGAGR
jgi:glycine/D-amino acid oxidase-like deaminating enzyme